MLTWFGTVDNSGTFELAGLLMQVGGVVGPGEQASIRWQEVAVEEVAVVVVVMVNVGLELSLEDSGTLFEHYGLCAACFGSIDPFLQ